MKGKEVRAMILDNNVYLWQVAEALGIADTTFTKHLRKDFTDVEVDRIKTIIADLQAEKKPV